MRCLALDFTDVEQEYFNLCPQKTDIPKFFRKNCGHLPVYCYETDPEEKGEGGGIAPPRASTIEILKSRVLPAASEVSIDRIITDPSYHLS